MQKVNITSGIFGSNFAILCSKNISGTFYLSKGRMWLEFFLNMGKNNAFLLPVQT